MISLKIIKNFPYFSTFAPEELEEVVKNSSLTTMNEGEVLFEEGTKRDSFYIVISGEVAIVRKFGEASEVVEIITEGEYIAEHALFSSEHHHSHTALIHSDKAYILKLEGVKFTTLLLETRYKLILNLLPIISDNFYHASNRIMTLFQIGKILGLSQENTKVVGKEILNVVLTGIHAEKALIALIDMDKSKINIVATNGFNKSDDIQGDKYLLKDTPILEDIIKAKESVTFTEKEYSLSSKKVPYIKKTLLGVPLIIGNNVIGAVVLIDKKSSNDFNTNNEVLLNITSHIIALELSHLQHQEIRIAEEELKREYISV